MNEYGYLTGCIDVFLIDKQTNQVVKHVQQQNQMTEAFARWLLAGNLVTPSLQGNTDTVVYTTNPISSLLHSHPVLKTDPPQINSANNVIDGDLRQGYQIVEASCGTGRYGMYLLSEPVDITGNTQIPPYFDSTLFELNDKVVFYGNATTINDGIVTMQVGRAQSIWGQVGASPTFSVVYVRNEGVGTVQSVVLGGIHEQVPFITVLQSPPELPAGWDTAWDTYWHNNPSSGIPTDTRYQTQLIPSKPSTEYLIMPFQRNAMSNGRYGDGLYAVGTDMSAQDTTTFINYYDLASGQFENNREVNARRDNGFTGERYTTVREHLLNKQIEGGFGLGNQKAVRMNKGREILDDAGNCVGRTVVFHYQSTLAHDNTPPSRYYETPVLYATEGTFIPETIYKNAAPVMLAKRGASEENDTIEVYVSLGSGEFTEYTDEYGTHPGGTGIEIHKYSLFVNDYRQSTATLANIIDNVPGTLQYHGRVAVLPYAIGRLCEEQSTEMDILTTGLEYLSGTYDSFYDRYYLPITHLLKGITPQNWQYSDTVLNAREPVLCARDTFQPGVVLNGSDFEFLREYIFSLDGSNIAVLSTDSGMQSLTVNRRQRWSACLGAVMSAVNLAEPVEKKEEHRLLVQYSYKFGIYAETSETFDDFIVDVVNERDAWVQYGIPPKNATVFLYRSMFADFRESQSLDVRNAYTYDSYVLLMDYNLEPGTYYYRLRLWTGSAFSAYTTASITI